MNDYTGKTVYVGIDVHKKSYSVCCFCDSIKIKSWTMQADNVQLIEQLHRYFKGAKIKSAYEAGFSGNVLHRQLINANVENIVVNPGSIEVASRDRVKTDKRDAKKLGQQLSYGQLECVYIPSEEEELARQTVRLRAMLVKDRARMACRIKSKLMQFGYWGAEDMEITSTKFIKKLGKKFDTYPKQLVRVLEYLCEQWLRLSEEIKRLDIEIQKETQENPLLEELEGIYRSVPGIGKISSNELCRELGDLSQFSNIKKAYSFTGLTPSESSSGEKVRRGHISHCGRPRIRKLLIEIAWRSINRDKSLSEKFKRIAGERGKKRAIVAIARILVGRMRACLLSKKNYELTAIS